ncbi:MAG TPA: glycoside hydrolase family 27 protein [Sphingomonas sp.]|nr:glycoside hydrolase family 27 protein [Sphingomonas sp.]
MIKRVAKLAIMGALMAASPASAHPTPKPPMGWNSWDAYGFTLTEAQLKADAGIIAGLKRLGWSYVVIDEGWYMRNPLGESLETRDFLLDGNGILIPDPKRFPSASDGRGFKTLADWTHARGLKFGIHIIRGIPKEAVRKDLPIANSDFRATDAADTQDLCPWEDSSYGIKDNAAGQAWYDALLHTYAKWGVDFLKVDCIADHPYRESEIRQIARAIAKTGRPIVLSLSPGPASLDHAETFGETAQMWRVADDLWDRWSFAPDRWPNGVRSVFDNLAKWNAYTRPGHWPDPDMLPFGMLAPHPGWGELRRTQLSADEERTLFTIDAIARAPLILGGNPGSYNAAELAIINNAEVIALDQQPRSSRPVTNLPQSLGQARVWTSTPAGTSHVDTVAVFNLAEQPLRLNLPWAELGTGQGAFAARELWSGKRIGCARTVKLNVAPHGVAVFRVDSRPACVVGSK